MRRTYVYILYVACLFTSIISLILQQNNFLNFLRFSREKIVPSNVYYAAKVVKEDARDIYEQNQTSGVRNKFSESIIIQDQNDTDMLVKIKQHRLTRSENFDSWFAIGNDGKNNRLKTNADADGPILDFAIVGFPKTGTSTMMANREFPMLISFIFFDLNV